MVRKKDTYPQDPNPTEIWNGTSMVSALCYLEQTIVEQAEAAGTLLTLVNHDWLFQINEELFKQKLQGAENVTRKTP